MYQSDGMLMHKVLGLAACLLSSCAERTVSPTDRGTVMLYLPGAQGGLSGTIVPYDVSPGSRGRSVAALILKRTTASTQRQSNGGAAIRKLDDVSKSDGRCASQRCPSEPEHSDFKPRTVILDATPEAVIGVALALLKKGLPADELSIRAGLSISGQPAPNSGVVTSIVVQSYPCAYNWDSVPKNLIASVCRDRATVEKISIGGQPGIMIAKKLTRLSFDSDIRLWYSERQLTNDAYNVGLITTDVSNQYDSAWPGHMPLMTSHIRINSSCACLAVAETGGGRHSDETGMDVFALDVYLSLK